MLFAGGAWAQNDPVTPVAYSVPVLSSVEIGLEEGTVSGFGGTTTDHVAEGVYVFSSDDWASVTEVKAGVPLPAGVVVGVKVTVAALVGFDFEENVGDITDEEEVLDLAKLFISGAANKEHIILLGDTPASGSGVLSTGDLEFVVELGDVTMPNFKVNSAADGYPFGTTLGSVTDIEFEFLTGGNSIADDIVFSFSTTSPVSFVGVTTALEGTATVFTKDGKKYASVELTDGSFDDIPVGSHSVVVSITANDTVETKDGLLSLKINKKDITPTLVVAADLPEVLNAGVKKIGDDIAAPPQFSNTEYTIDYAWGWRKAGSSSTAAYAAQTTGKIRVGEYELTLTIKPTANTKFDANTTAALYAEQFVNAAAVATGIKSPAFNSDRTILTFKVDRTAVAQPYDFGISALFTTFVWKSDARYTGRVLWTNAAAAGIADGVALDIGFAGTGIPSGTKITTTAGYGSVTGETKITLPSVVADLDAGLHTIVVTITNTALEINKSQTANLIITSEVITTATHFTTKLNVPKPAEGGDPTSDAFSWVTSGADLNAYVTAKIDWIGDFVDGKFMATGSYTPKVTLTAKDNYIFNGTAATYTGAAFFVSGGSETVTAGSAAPNEGTNSKTVTVNLTGISVAKPITATPIVFKLGAADFTVPTVGVTATPAVADLASGGDWASSDNAKSPAEVSPELAAGAKWTAVAKWKVQATNSDGLWTDGVGGRFVATNATQYRYGIEVTVTPGSGYTFGSATAAALAAAFKPVTPVPTTVVNPEIGEDGKLKFIVVYPVIENPAFTLEMKKDATGKVIPYEFKSTTAPTLVLSFPWTSAQATPPTGLTLAYSGVEGVTFTSNNTVAPVFNSTTGKAEVDVVFPIANATALNAGTYSIGVTVVEGTQAILGSTPVAASNLSFTVSPKSLSGVTIASVTGDGWSTLSKTYSPEPTVPLISAVTTVSAFNSTWGASLPGSNVSVQWEAYEDVDPTRQPKIWLTATGSGNFTGTSAKTNFTLTPATLSVTDNFLMTIKTPVAGETYTATAAGTNNYEKVYGADAFAKQFTAKLAWAPTTAPTPPATWSGVFANTDPATSYTATLTLTPTKNYQFASSGYTGSKFLGNTVAAAPAAAVADGKLGITAAFTPETDAVAAALKELTAAFDNLRTEIPQAEISTEAGAKTYVESLIKGVWGSLTNTSSVVATVRGTWVEPDWAAGSDGSYRFDVLLKKGALEQATSSYTISITREAVDVAGNNGVVLDRRGKKVGAIVGSEIQYADWDQGKVYGIVLPKVDVTDTKEHGSDNQFEVVEVSYTATGGFAAALGYAKTFKKAVDGDKWASEKGTSVSSGAANGVPYAGTYTVRVRMASKITNTSPYGYPASGISRDITFTVRAKDIKSAKMEISLTAEEKVYDGRVKDYDRIKVTDGSKTLQSAGPGVEAVDVAWSFAEQDEAKLTNAGTAEIVVKGENNYTGTLVGTFTIAPMTIDFASGAVYAFTKEFDGTRAVVTDDGDPGIQFVDANKVALNLEFGADNDYTVTGFQYNSATVGTDKTVEGTVVLGSKASNYALKTKAFKATGQVIEKGTPAAVHIATNPALSVERAYDVKYDAKAHAVTASWVSGIPANSGKITVKYSTEDGKAPVEMGDYTITADVEEGVNFKAAQGITLGALKISEALPPIITRQPVSDTLYYAGGSVILSVAAVNPKDGKTSGLKYQWYEVTDTGAVLLKGKTSATYTENRKVVGDYTFYVVVTYSANDQAAASVTSEQSRVRVNPEPVSLADALVAVGRTYPYTGSKVEPDLNDLQVTLGTTGLVGGVDYEFAANGIKHTGDAGLDVGIVTIKGINAYKGTATGTFTVDKIQLSLDQHLNVSYVKEYNGEAQPIAVSLKTGFKGVGAITAEYTPDSVERLGAGEWSVVLHIEDGTNFYGIEDLPLPSTYRIRKASWSTELFNIVGLDGGRKDVAWTGEDQGIAKPTLKDLGAKYTGDFRVVYDNGGEYSLTAVDSSRTPYTVKIQIDGDDNFAKDELTIGTIVINGADWVSVAEGSREIPAGATAEAVTIAPAVVNAGSVSVGPNPIAGGELLNIYWSGSKAVSGKLFVYTSVGKKVAAIDVSGTKKIGAWRTAGAPAGTYLVKGVLSTKDGAKVKVSTVVGVAR